MGKLKTLNKTILEIILMVALTFAICKSAEAAQLKVSLVLDSGTVLIYNGREAGLRQGDVLNVVRNSENIGTLKVTQITAHYVVAIIVSQEKSIVEGDRIGVVDGISPLDMDSQKTAKPFGVVDIGSNPDASKSKSDQPAKSEPKSSGASDKKTGTEKTPSKSTASDSKKTTASSDTKKTTAPKEEKKTDVKSSDKKEAAPAEKKTGTDTTKKASTAKPTEKKEPIEKKASKPESDEDAENKKEPQVLGIQEPYVTVSFGYFYLKSDVPGDVTGDKPALMSSLDYWVPKKTNKRIFYSVLYSRPDVTTFYENQYHRYQLRIIEFMSGMVIDSKGSIGLGSSTYYGLATGYRSATSQIYSETSKDFTKKSMEGFDYHALVGIKAQKKTDIRLDYCIDENYYIIGVGMRY